MPDQIESLGQLRDLCYGDSDEREFWRWVTVAACADLCPLPTKADNEEIELLWSLSQLDDRRRHHWDSKADPDLAQAAICGEINLVVNRLMAVECPDSAGLVTVDDSAGTSSPTMCDRPSPALAGLDPFDLRYPGSKGVDGHWQWICSLLPSHVYYAEPFAGKGAIFRNKVPALRSWLIDLDHDVITWWHRQRGRGSTIVGTDGAAGNIVMPDDGIHNRPSLVAMVGCGIRWVELAAEWAGPDLLVYCDPPYLLSTRVKKKLYRHEMTDTDHLRLLHALKQLRGPAVISGYDSEMYRSELADWTFHKRAVITRGGTLRDDCLWIKGETSHRSSVAMQYSELAGSWRERERINRKRSRWRANFERLPAKERRAILLSLLDAERAKVKG